MIPLIDYNFNNIIDEQMYGELESSQQWLLHAQDVGINNFGDLDSKTERKTFHILYDDSTHILRGINVSSDVAKEQYYLLFKEGLEAALKSSDETYANKGKLNENVYYYMIHNYEGDYYLISILSSDYSDDIVASFRNQVIYIQYGFLIVIAAVLILWLVNLIQPLKKIHGYIYTIKDRKEATLEIRRKDEIGDIADALVEMNTQLALQEKIKEEMIHNISHDLKTPISLIKTYGQSVKDDIYPYGDKNSSMDVILDNADRLEHKVKSFLYLNRLDYLQGMYNEISPFGMKEIVDKVVDQLDALSENVELIKETEDVVFLGQEEHWRVAIENIIENATRYAKTKIVIILKENYLEIFNDGELIDEDTLKLLFDPYATGVKGQFGLGLSISRKIADMYGYELSAHNSENGVSFVFEKKK